MQETAWVAGVRARNRAGRAYSAPLHLPSDGDGAICPLPTKSTPLQAFQASLVPAP